MNQVGAGTENSSVEEQYALFMLNHQLLLHVEYVAVSSTHNTYMLCYEMLCKKDNPGCCKKEN